jgi:RHS repeat-associated protein
MLSKPQEVKCQPCWCRTSSGAKMYGVYTTEGRVSWVVFPDNPTNPPDPPKPQYEYTLRDHPGNGRVYISDKNGDGFIQVEEDDMGGSPGYTEIIQENHYYPFGLNMTGPWDSPQWQPGNAYQYNGKEWNEDLGLNLYDYGVRWYDAAVGRFTTIDRFAGKYYPMTPYQYGANNPILIIDINGDSVVYANANIKAFVQRYASETKTTRKGKIKKNRNYNAGFAKLIGELEASKDIFVLTDDASKIQGEDAAQLGEFNVAKDGSQFNVVVPDFTSGEKAKLLDLFGGRGAVLAEEVFHATQYLNGGVEKVESRDGTFSLKAASTTTTILLEADAKIFATNSGMANLNTSSYISGYTIPTMSGLIKKAKGNRQKVGRLLIYGTTKIVTPTFGGGGTKSIKYKPSYSIY